MQNNSSHLKTVYKWGIAQLKICKWFSSDRVRFPLPSLLFIFLQIPSLGLCTVYVFFHLKFFLRDKGGKDEYLEKILLPLHLTVRFLPTLNFLQCCQLPFAGVDVQRLILSAGCLSIQDGMQILPNQSILDLFTAQDNTLFISI